LEDDDPFLLGPGLFSGRTFPEMHLEVGGFEPPKRVENSGVSKFSKKL